MTGFPSSKKLSGVAVDFGGTKIAAARICAGRIVKRLQIVTPKMGGLPAVLEAITGLASQLELNRDDLLALAPTGRVDHSGNWHGVNLATLMGVSNVPLKTLIEQQTGCPAVVVNDAQAAALAEARLGAGEGKDPLGFITVSTGVGGGFVFSGKSYSAPNGLQGHVGFSSSQYARSVCGSGRERTVESIASGTAIAKEAALVGHAGKDAKDVFECFANGESWAAKIIGTSAKSIADLCVNLRTLLGLERIVLGGSVGLGTGYLNLVRTYVSQEPELFQVELAPAKLGHDAGLFGALLYAQDMEQKNPSNKRDSALAF